jgi:hypothetical protein
MSHPTYQKPPPGLRGPVPLFATLEVPRQRWQQDPDGCRAELRRRLEQVAASIPTPTYRLAGGPQVTLTRPFWDRSRPKPGMVVLYGRGRGVPA